MSEATLRRNTDFLLDNLPLAKLQQVFDYVLNLCDDEDIFAPISKERMLDDLAMSREQVERGEYMDFDDAIDEISVELGI